MSHRQPENREAWDAICERCARCCYEKIEFEGKVYYTEVPCQYLDLKTKTCRVYDERDTVRKGCVRLTPELLGKGFLPADCPYVRDIKDYPAPTLAAPEDEDL